MPSFGHIVYGVYGAWRLARLDRGGMAYFEQTVEGFWRSFFAAALVAPGYVILVLADLAAHDSDVGVLRIFAVHICAYALSWVVYPVAVHPICAAMNRQGDFIGFIVAFNWAKVIQMAAYLPVIVMTTAEVLPAGMAGALNGFIYILLFGYQWFVTRTALDIRPFAAVGLVGLDLIIGVIISAMALGMVR